MPVSNLVLLIFTLAFTFIGVWATLKFIKIYRIFQSALHWPSISGRISESNVVEHDCCYPHIKYTFTIDDQSFEGHKLFPYDDWSCSRKTARQSCSQYFVGKEVPIFYNPRDPQQSCLQNRASPFKQLEWFCAIIFTLAGFFFAAWLILRITS